MRSKGYSLVELLFTVLILGVVVAIIALVIPTKIDIQKQQQKDIDVILHAIEEYKVDTDGNLPQTITKESTEICKTEALNCKGLVDLSFLTRNEKYLISIPINPADGTDNGTGYLIKKDDSQVVITAISEL